VEAVGSVEVVTAEQQAVDYMGQDKCLMGVEETRVVFQSTSDQQKFGLAGRRSSRCRL